MMRRFIKIICAVAALCLFATAPASVSTTNASALSSQPIYNFDEIMTPVWEGNISYMETVLPVENEYGGIDPIELLYPIGQVIEVKNAELTVTYQKGIDYAVSGGKLLIADDGNIPVMSYDEFHPATGQSGMEDKNGGYICFSEGDYFHSKQIVVTYTHTETYAGYVPEGKGNLLPKVTEKLSKGEDLDLLVFGDSISVGANSSSLVGASPYMPTYPELFVQQLKTVYGSKINLTNPSVGGKGIAWGLDEINGVLENQNDLDLAVLAFGMNDGRMSALEFAQKISTLAERVQERFPDAEVMLVATMLPNPDAEKFDLNQNEFHDMMLEYCQEEGVAVVDMTAVHEGLLQRKRYADMTGNNVNHPNDYMARVYAQTLFATLQQPIETPPSTDPDGQQSGTVADQLLSGCTSTLSLTAGTVTVLCAAAITLKKKKDD